MAYEQLSLSSFVKEMKEVTDGAHPRKFCFVLGAGASKTSGIKSGQELVKIWDKDLRERNEEEYNRWRKELSITDENMFSFYSQYYEKRFCRCRADGYNYIEKIMDSAKPSAGYVMLAHLLTKTPHNVVITTNFDHLTEDAMNYYAQNTPLVIGHEALSHYVSGLPVRPTIIKIHRDLLFDPKSRTEDLEKLPDSWKNTLELIFSNYHPVFIGYAGNDKSLMDFLLENGSKFADDEWKYPYWLLYKTDAIEGKVKAFLEKSKGLVIFHGGFDEVMIQLGATFDYVIPSEEIFLGDARKRYKALADAIDALSDRSKTSNKTDAIPCSTAKPFDSGKENEELNEDNQSINQAIQKITSMSEMQRMYREALTLQQEKNYSSAAEIMKQLVELDPENARYHHSFGDILKHLKKGEEALAEYRRAAELEPNNESYHFWFASSLDEAGQYKEALAEYRKAAELDPEDDVNRFFTGLMLEKTGQYEEALAEYEKSVALESEDDLNRCKVAEMLIKLNRYEDAMVSIEKAIELDPKFPYYYDVLGGILRHLGHHEKADIACKKAVELRNSAK